MTPARAKTLAAEFRMINSKFEEENCNPMFFNGICYALSRLREDHNQNDDSNDAYDDVNEVLKIVQNNWTNERGYLTIICSDFTDRATMCLLMAEWLETDEDFQEVFV